ncbi:MAG: hypothetical protein U1E34_07575 [Amaricoccus sp.]
MTRRRSTRATALLVLGLLLLAGCGTLPRHPVPEALKAEAEIPGYGAIRYWGDDAHSISPDMLDLVDRQSRAAGRTGPRNFLAISGGGSDGAFGAGPLFGWSAKGTRPHFDIVTGIGTGSLTAPFAFLGKPYDQELRDSYTRIDTADIPPVRIHVVADGVAYDALHVDGGTSNQAFMLPSNLSLRDIDRRYGISRQRTLYVIRNGKVTPDYRAVPARGDRTAAVTGAFDKRSGRATSSPAHQDGDGIWTRPTRRRASSPAPNSFGRPRGGS